jgi:membrane protein YdbS with pleckstrin-like domain
MTDALSRPLLAALRVPPEPRLPAGEPRSARVFRAGANFWTLRLLEWSAKQAVTLFAFVFVWLTVLPATVTPAAVPYARVVQLLEGLATAIWLVQLPVTFLILRLDYELRWYIVTDRAARLREGILSLREMTFTLANVQDIRIRQGPLQRLLGLADVELRTAGGSEAPVGQGEHAGHAGQNLHLARFRGVDNAQVIRDLVMDRMKKASGAGLGDPDDAPEPPPVRAVTQDLDAAVRELVEESRRLREAAERR